MFDMPPFEMVYCFFVLFRRHPTIWFSPFRFRFGGIRLLACPPCTLILIGSGCFVRCFPTMFSLALFWPLALFFFWLTWIDPGFHLWVLA